jgi:hypothetical protein
MQNTTGSAPPELKGRPIGKGSDHASLQLKVALKCGDPKTLVDVMKDFPRSTYLFTQDNALGGVAHLSKRDVRNIMGTRGTPE